MYGNQESKSDKILEQGESNKTMRAMQGKILGKVWVSCTRSLPLFEWTDFLSIDLIEGSFGCAIGWCYRIC